MRSVPAAGCSCPVIIRNSVVLPAPLGPMTPTMPPGGSENDRSSMSRLSPKPLRRCSASTTTFPRWVEVGMWIWTSSSLTLRSWATSASKLRRRAFCLAWRPFGFWRAEQEAAQRDAATLATGQSRDVGVGGRQAQRVHRVLDVGVEVPRVGGVDAGLQRGELVGGLVGVAGGQLVEAVEERARGGDAVLDVASDVLGLVE